MSRTNEPVENVQKTTIDDLVPEIVDRLVRSLQAEKIILFGSYAEGRATDDSDLDLVVVASSQLPSRERNRAARRALGGLPLPVDVFVYRPDEFAFYADLIGSIPRTALTRGKVLYES